MRPRRVVEPVSLVDLLPTLMDIAGEGSPMAPALPLDGESLIPAATGKAPPAGIVHGEYLAEGTDQPMFMIRRGSLKYVGCAGDPPLLFDLGNDPLEQNNLAASKKHGKDARGFAAEVSTKWDGPALRRSVLESQRARRLVHGALTTGRIHPWDFTPTSEAASEYYRNYGRPDAERRLRYPRTVRSRANPSPPGKRR
jgi:choline-sulfatase